MNEEEIIDKSKVKILPQKINNNFLNFFELSFASMQNKK
jgi:hypothetical protein